MHGRKPWLSQYVTIIKAQERLSPTPLRLRTTMHRPKLMPLPAPLQLDYRLLAMCALSLRQRLSAKLLHNQDLQVWRIRLRLPLLAQMFSSILTVILGTWRKQMHKHLPLQQVEHRRHQQQQMPLQMLLEALRQAPQLLQRQWHRLVAENSFFFGCQFSCRAQNLHSFAPEIM